MRGPPRAVTTALDGTTLCDATHLARPHHRRPGHLVAKSVVRRSRSSPCSSSSPASGASTKRREQPWPDRRGHTGLRRLREERPRRGAGGPGGERLSMRSLANEASLPRPWRPSGGGGRRRVSADGCKGATDGQVHTGPVPSNGSCHVRPGLRRARAQARPLGYRRGGHHRGIVACAADEPS